MSQSTTVSPIEVGAMSALVGAGVGYAAAPRKYTLEQLLTLKEDVFEKTLSEKVFSGEGMEAKIARNTIVDGRKLIKEASKNNTAEGKLAELLRSADLDAAYKSIKSYLPKARAQSALIMAILSGFVGTLAKVIYDEKKS